MEKKQEDLLSMLDFSSMSKSELDNIQGQMNERYKVLEDEAAKKRAIKDNYHIDVPEKVYEPNYYAFYTRVMGLAKHGSVLSPDQILQIDKNTQIPLDYDYCNVYRCPNCGMFGLSPVVYVGYNEHHGTFIIECDCCDFQLPKKYVGYYEKEAWKQFHTYLQVHGYLSEDVKFPE